VPPEAPIPHRIVAARLDLASRAGQAPGASSMRGMPRRTCCARTAGPPPA